MSAGGEPHAGFTEEELTEPEPAPPQDVPQPAQRWTLAMTAQLVKAVRQHLLTSSSREAAVVAVEGAADDADNGALAAQPLLPAKIDGFAAEIMPRVRALVNDRGLFHLITVERMKARWKTVEGRERASREVSDGVRAQRRKTQQDTVARQQRAQRELALRGEAARAEEEAYRLRKADWERVFASARETGASILVYANEKRGFDGKLSALWDVYTEMSSAQGFDEEISQLRDQIYDYVEKDQSMKLYQEQFIKDSLTQLYEYD